MPDPHQIADTLSEAQRRILCELPVKRAFKPEYYGQWSALSVLKAKRLINSVKDFTYGKQAEHVVTPFGLAVRAILEERNASS